jgi:hypothetical protein
MTTTTAPHRQGGRPPSRPLAFATALLAHREGVTPRHARRLLLDSLGALDSRDWYAVAVAIGAGLETVAEFEDFIRQHLD